MPEKIRKLTFDNGRGQSLDARLELPAGEVHATALFAHCFTCSKDIAAVSRVSRELRKRGFAVLRFDFTGLGNSEGDFANTNFSSNVDDLLAASRALSREGLSPSLLIGHSLGGAAVLVAAGDIDSARAVVTIGAPAEITHIQHIFRSELDRIETEGEAHVELGGREFRITRQFVEDLREHRLEEAVHALRMPLLLLHSPQDEVVDIDHARRIFEAALHPKSFISLDGADHLVSDRRDSQYIAELIRSWASRYIGSRERIDVSTPDPGAFEDLDFAEVRVRSRGDGFAQDVSTGRGHRLVADEPEDVGGGNLGPDPYALLLAGLGACTNMTLHMYARRKEWALESVSTTLRHSKVHASDCESCQTKEGKVDRIDRVVGIEGRNLTEEQRTRLLEMANRCPVHRTLSSEIEIRTTSIERR